ncbi:MAG: hypothetical protein O6946_06735 [Gammaproteobacteria bacterium]|nr:hypothetical protein [Gammaproteobacteria bacterium]
MRPTSAFQHALRLARFESSLDPRHLETRLGPHAGRQALTLYSVPPELESPDIPLLDRLPGFSLHAATMCEAHQRRKLAGIDSHPIAQQFPYFDNAFLICLTRRYRPRKDSGDPRNTIHKWE